MDSNNNGYSVVMWIGARGELAIVAQPRRLGFALLGFQCGRGRFDEMAMRSILAVAEFQPVSRGKFAQVFQIPENGRFQSLRSGSEIVVRSTEGFGNYF